ncbi:hypothetical protein M959_02300, partial [Chaetura pelagica]
MRSRRTFSSFLFGFVRKQIIKEALLFPGKQTNKQQVRNKRTACPSSPEERGCENMNPNITLFNSQIKHWKKKK